jgi:hypothetical protein
MGLLLGGLSRGRITQETSRYAYTTISYTSTHMMLQYTGVCWLMQKSYGASEGFKKEGLG